MTAFLAALQQPVAAFLGVDQHRWHQPAALRRPVPRVDVDVRRPKAPGAVVGVAVPVLEVVAVPAVEVLFVSLESLSQQPAARRRLLLPTAVLVAARVVGAAAAAAATAAAAAATAAAAAAAAGGGRRVGDGWSGQQFLEPTGLARTELPAAGHPPRSSECNPCAALPPHNTPPHNSAHESSRCRASQLPRMLTQTEHARPDVCVGAAHPQLPGMEGGWGVSPSTAPRGAARGPAGGTRCRDLALRMLLQAAGL